MLKRIIYGLMLKERSLSLSFENTGKAKLPNTGLQQVFKNLAEFENNRITINLML
jgi:hypothetical protein